MQREFVMVLLLAVPVILFSAAFNRYVGTGGITIIIEAGARWITRKREVKTAKARVK